MSCHVMSYPNLTRCFCWVSFPLRLHPPRIGKLKGVEIIQAPLGPFRIQPRRRAETRTRRTHPGALLTPIHISFRHTISPFLTNETTLPKRRETKKKRKRKLTGNFSPIQKRLRQHRPLLHLLLRLILPRTTVNLHQGGASPTYFLKRYQARLDHGGDLLRGIRCREREMREEDSEGGAVFDALCAALALVCEELVKEMGRVGVNREGKGKGKLTRKHGMSGIPD